MIWVLIGQFNYSPTKIMMRNLAQDTQGLATRLRTRSKNVNISNISISI